VGEAAGLQQQTEQPKTADAFWLAYYGAVLAIARGQWREAQLALTQAEGLGEEDGERLICAAYARAWLLRRQGLFQETIDSVNEALARDWDLPPYRALLALERELAITFAGGAVDQRQVLSPELASFIRLRARAGLVTLHALLALRCRQAGDGRWRRHAQAVLRARARPGYARLLTRRDPDLGAQFWALCLSEGLAPQLASAALAEIGAIAPILPLLGLPDSGARSRAAQALAAVGREDALPALAAAVEKEPDPAAAQVMAAALDTLEHSPPPVLRVQLMGEFGAWRGERPIQPEDWQRPGVRRLFQYLALHRGQRLPRDRILQDLWGDTDPASARASFKQLFSWLRRTLEPFMRPRAPSRYISVEEDVYCFGARPEICRTDWEEFQSTVGPALAEAKRQEVPALPEALLAGLSHWQPLLPDLPYEGWTLDAREKAQQLYIEGCLYVAESLLGLDRAAEAADWAERAVTSGPWLEEGYQALMRAQARQGNRSLALKTYAAAAAALKNELGLAPAPLTEWLAKRLRGGEEI
jgi:DNA-binding SARP family transcriptional activator